MRTIQPANNIIEEPGTGTESLHSLVTIYRLKHRVYRMSCPGLATNCLKKSRDFTESDCARDDVTLFYKKGASPCFS